MKRSISIFLAIFLCLAMVSPAFAVSAAQLVGYWKGTFTATFNVSDQKAPNRASHRVKVSLASNGTGSWRHDQDFDFTNRGTYYVRKNRLIMELTEDYQSTDPYSWHDETYFDLSVKLSGNSLTLKGYCSTDEAYSSNVVMKLKRIKPTIKKVSANKVVLGDPSTVTVNVDQYVDFVRMTDASGRELKFSYDEFKSNKFRIEHTFSAKSNKVKIYAGMRTDDGFIFWSPAKSLTVKCK